MEILRLLMVEPATLSQLGARLGHSPAWVRHHIQKLESANLVELSEIRKTGKVTEKFYRASATVFLLQDLVLPKSGKPILIFSGSHDLAIDLIAQNLHRYVHLVSLPVGSLEGLVNLRQGLCQVSGAHLLGEDGEYNTSYVRSIFPDREMEIMTFAHRVQGLAVPRSNPLGIRSISDLAQTGLRFINRNLGSGTRLWLDAELKRLGISHEYIEGYANSASTHTETARAVAEGRADATVGLQAAAQQCGLDFIPLFNERYDLIFPHEHSNQLDIFLNYIQSKDFKNQLSRLSGYEFSNIGKQVALN
jgi:putative molybdopterin biosynthesis protein